MKFWICTKNGSFTHWIDLLREIFHTDSCSTIQSWQESCWMWRYAAALECFDKKLRIVWISQLFFVFQFLSWSSIVPYQFIIFMVASNCRSYWKWQQPSHIIYKQHICTNICTYTQIRHRYILELFNKRLIEFSPSIRQSLFCQWCLPCHFTKVCTFQSFPPYSTSFYSLLVSFVFKKPVA